MASLTPNQVVDDVCRSEEEWKTHLRTLREAKVWASANIEQDFSALKQHASGDCALELKITSIKEHIPVEEVVTMFKGVHKTKKCSKKFSSDVIDAALDLILNPLSSFPISQVLTSDSTLYSMPTQLQTSVAPSFYSTAHSLPLSFAGSANLATPTQQAFTSPKLVPSGVGASYTQHPLSPSTPPFLESRFINPSPQLYSHAQHTSNGQKGPESSNSLKLHESPVLSPSLSPSISSQLPIEKTISALSISPHPGVQTDSFRYTDPYSAPSSTSSSHSMPVFSPSPSVSNMLPSYGKSGQRSQPGTLLQPSFQSINSLEGQRNFVLEQALTTDRAHQGTQNILQPIRSASAPSATKSPTLLPSSHNSPLLLPSSSFDQNTSNGSNGRLSYPFSLYPASASSSHALHSQQEPRQNGAHRTNLTQSTDSRLRTGSSLYTQPASSYATDNLHSLPHTLVLPTYGSCERNGFESMLQTCPDFPRPLTEVLRDVTTDRSHTVAIEAILERSNKDSKMRYTLKTLYHINNDYLTNRFNFFKEMVAKVKGTTSGGATVKTVVHGTKFDFAKEIARVGFLSEKIQRTLHGKAHYFSMYPHIAAGFTGDMTLVICEVCDEKAELVPEKDTSGKNANYITVKYDIGILPLYILQFDVFMNEDKAN